MDLLELEDKLKKIEAELEAEGNYGTQEHLTLKVKIARKKFDLAIENKLSSNKISNAYYNLKEAENERYSFWPGYGDPSARINEYWDRYYATTEAERKRQFLKDGLELPAFWLAFNENPKEYRIKLVYEIRRNADCSKMFEWFYKESSIYIEYPLYNLALKVTGSAKLGIIDVEAMHQGDGWMEHNYSRSIGKYSRWVDISFFQIEISERLHVTQKKNNLPVDPSYLAVYDVMKYVG